MRPRHTRFIAKLMAFVWLFGFAVAVANACATQLAALSAADPAHASCELASAPVDPDDTQACQTACQGLCEVGQTAVAKTKSADGPSLATLAPLPGPACVWPAASATPHWVVHAPLPPPSPPVAILFLRLTI